jgi:hypothetical protein
MPNLLSDVPIDWASVNWLYVAVLSGLVFCRPDQHIGSRCCDFGLLFAAGRVWTYYRGLR